MTTAASPYSRTCVLDSEAVVVQTILETHRPLCSVEDEPEWSDPVEVVGEQRRDRIGVVALLPCGPLVDQTQDVSHRPSQKLESLQVWLP